MRAGKAAWAPGGGTCVLCFALRKAGAEGVFSREGFGIPFEGGAILGGGTVWRVRREGVMGGGEISAVSIAASCVEKSSMRARRRRETEENADRPCIE